MGKRRDPQIDEVIRRMLLEDKLTKVICDEVGVSEATVSRRRQELRILAIRSPRQYEKHQEQLIELVQDLKKDIVLPEPAFMDIEYIYKRRRWNLEWETLPGHQTRLIIPIEIQQKTCQSFSKEVENKTEILPLFKAHTQDSELWQLFDKWSEIGGQYMMDCWKRLSEIRHRVSIEKPKEIPFARKTTEVKGAVRKDVTPKVCILPMYYWTIYSYPLRTDVSNSMLEYKETGLVNGIYHVSLYCAVDNCSSIPLFRAPADRKEDLINIHQKLLDDYKLVSSLKVKYAKLNQIVKSI